METVCENRGKESGSLIKQIAQITRIERKSRIG